MKYLMLYDVHAPYHDEESLEIAISYGLKSKINHVILAGDFVDFYRISYWKTDPTRMPFPDEVNLCRKILRDMRSRIKKPITLLAGNHELRLQSYLWNKAPEIVGIDSITVPGLLALDKFKIQYMDNVDAIQRGVGPLSLGKLHVLHGHEFRVSGRAVNIAKIYYERAGVNIIMGHHHRTQEWMVRKLNGKIEGCYAVGCLCDMSPDYMPLNNWNHGFAIVSVSGDGRFSVWNKKIIEGRVM